MTYALRSLADANAFSTLLQFALFAGALLLTLCGRTYRREYPGESEPLRQQDQSIKDYETTVKKQAAARDALLGKETIRDYKKTNGKCAAETYYGELDRNRERLALFYLARAFQKQKRGDLDGAEADLKAAVETASRRPTLYAGLQQMALADYLYGKLLLERGKYAEADRLYDQAIDLIQYLVWQNDAEEIEASEKLFEVKDFLANVCQTKINLVEKLLSEDVKQAQNALDEAIGFFEKIVSEDVAKDDPIVAGKALYFLYKVRWIKSDLTKAGEFTSDVERLVIEETSIVDTGKTDAELDEAIVLTKREIEKGEEATTIVFAQQYVEDYEEEYGEEAAAEDAFAAEGVEDLVRLYIVRGAQRTRQGDRQGALEDFNAALDLLYCQGESYETLILETRARLGKGLLLRDEGRLKEADAEFQTGLNAVQELLKQRGANKLISGFFDDDEYELAIVEAKLDRFGLLQNRAIIAYELGDRVQSVETLGEAVKGLQRLADEFDKKFGGFKGFEPDFSELSQRLRQRLAEARSLQADLQNGKFNAAETKNAGAAETR